ncbi:melanoregulin-like isoform X2 [Etheostoma cragini]|uniref:melanoregulin-like isoform X2 n=1 Tax=Etheostoma cragini TaxID=417921 RepID=UPI00155DFD7F|nr:melanoregulin-like isoform X2 [Etheostoma cragini]
MDTTSNIAQIFWSPTFARPMGTTFTICCCDYYLKHNREEKNAILCMRTTAASTQPELSSSESSDSDIEEESLFGPQPSRRRPRNHQLSQRSTVDRWASTNRACESPIRRGSDRELQDFISMRDKADQATEEWEKLNYDIHTLRYARREVRSRWKKILLLLGYQREVDSLLCVNRQNRFSRDQEHLNKATELLKQLLDHTSLFPSETEHQNTYLCVMDRLVSLDSAEDFVRLAKEKYPKKVG